MKILTTFSGKFGDVLWSLPTVREINKIHFDETTEELIGHTGQVDFGVMPAYESLLPLLNAQPYINEAFVIKDWVTTGSPCGDQPWEAPVPEGYDKVYHLTYRNHPGRDQPLIDFIANQQGIMLENPVPFISIKTPDVIYNSVYGGKPFIAYAFNESMIEQKESFLKLVYAMLPEVDFVNISKNSWHLAAWKLQQKDCLAFIGCRSSNYVLACGVGKRVIIYEPNIARSRYGSWGTTFTCPYANETEVNERYGFGNLNEIITEIKSKLVEVK